MTASLSQPPLPAKNIVAYWQGVPASSLAFAITQVAKTYGKPICVITQDTLQIAQLETECRFFAPDLPVVIFPDWETLPYDSFSPHQDLISERLSALKRLPQITRGIILVSITTLMQRMPPRAYLSSLNLQYRVGDQINIDNLRHTLGQANYQCVQQVMEHGEFAIRGAIIDLFPMGSTQPYRLDLLDDEIETIRLFDPDTQLTVDTVQAIDVLPAREFPMTDQAISDFRKRWRARFNVNPLHCPIYEAISAGQIPNGIEYYLPLFFPELTHLFAYLPNDALLIKFPALSHHAEQFWQEIHARHEQLNYDITRPILLPQEIYLASNDILAESKSYLQIQINEESATAQKHGQSLACTPLPDVAIDNHHANPLYKLQHFIHEQSNAILICAESLGRREALHDLLQPLGLPLTIVDNWQDFLDNKPALALTVGQLTEGFIDTANDYIVISENNLFGQQVLQQRRRKQARDTEIIIKNLAELRVNEPVVHLQFGVGRYQGLTTLTIDNITQEFLILSYAGEDKIYVPVTSLELISRYSGGDVEHAPLHKLGTDKWQRDKQKAIVKIHDVAADLLELYAKRAKRKGFAFALPETYQQFARAFAFEETYDQQLAIEKVIEDLTAERPMDRLICGDVGFGKTEVAMRAAFIAAQNGKQVAILVPTTLLADQHYQNFQDRFADFAVNICLLSRFQNQKQQEETKKLLASGKCDIVIGTHKLIQKSIRFNNLGLVIIDEEHRFGVKQKEMLKTQLSNVDLLALTATPIPRTLNMAMTGMRDISIISTPPAKRLSIKTFMHKRNKQIIREAVLREIFRGGQVFFLHNKVDTIEKIAHDITQLLPEAKVQIAHGQMRELALEHVMRDFYHRRFNVLVCTTIIETGIDIPTANTIIIDRADHFGLAQLHQLRGRVGRSHHQAYAYLLLPDDKTMTADAKKRLEAFQSLDDLGAGFMLATHDLEIRGAGEILGEEQSGHMQAIGFSLYMELLERTIKTLQQGGKLTEDLRDQGVDINLNISALLPDDYVPDVHTRLTLYKRLAEITDKAQLDEFQVELIDRFGKIPESVKSLIRITQIKGQCQQMGICKITGNSEKITLELADKPRINTEKLLQLIQQRQSPYRLAGPTKLSYQVATNNADSRLSELSQLLQTLSGSV